MVVSLVQEVLVKIAEQMFVVAAFFFFSFFFVKSKLIFYYVKPKLIKAMNGQ